MYEVQTVSHSHVQSTDCVTSSCTEYRLCHILMYRIQTVSHPHVQSIDLIICCLLLFVFSDLHETSTGYEMMESLNEFDIQEQRLKLIRQRTSSEPMK